MKKNLLQPSSNFSKFYLRVLSFLLLTIGVVTSSKAQVSSYIATETSGATYTEITGGTVIINNSSAAFLSMVGFNNSAANTAVTIPFTFYYDNVGYTNVFISDNGFIILGTLVSAAIANTAPISGNTNNSAAIACYGANLASGALGGTAEIRYETIGTFPNRVFVVQYKDMQRRTSLTTLNGMMNMQIRLSEKTGVVQTIYRDAFSSTSATIFGGQIGLRGSVNTDFSVRKQTGLIWPSTTIVGTTNADVLNTQGVSPGPGVVQGNLAGTQFTWTPCFTPSTVLASMAGDNSTLNVSWTNPNVVPSAGIDWEVRTSGAGGSGASGLFASGNSSTNAVAVPGLSIGVAYCVYIKSNCRSAWITGPCVTPVCTVASIPYSQTFEGVTVTANTTNSPAPNNTVVGGYPPCNSLVTTSGAAWGTTNNSTLGYYGFNNKNMITNGALAQNAWYFTQVINFPSAGSYKLTYKYGGSREQSFFQQKMKVYYGSVASAAGMTTLLADHPDIKTSPETNTLNFLVSAPGTYYIGFYAYALASQGFLQLDDITVDYSSCLPPTSLVSGQVTSSSAIVAWTPPASAPSNGYQYYISTSNSAPVSTTVPSGVTTAGNNLTTITGLSASTTYYVWVRSVCSSTDSSIWSTTYCIINTPVSPVYCSPVGTPLDPSGITNVTMGSINNTTGLETNGYRDYSSLTTNVAQTATVSVNVTFATGFSYYYGMWVDWNNDGDFIDTGEAVYVSPAQSSGTVPTTVTFTFVVPTLDSNSASTLGPHRVRIGGIDDPSYTGGALTPCRNGAYQVFEDYSIYVTTPPPALTLTDGIPLSTSNTICAGDNTSGSPLSLSSNPASYQVYTWTPNNGTITGNILSGNISFNPTTTTTYILTASQTSGNFSSTTASYTVNVNPLPTPITVAPVAPTKCTSDAPLQLVSSGGVIPGYYTTVFNEDFNSATNTFTTVNNSVNGIPANPAWTTRTSPYVYGLTFSSNDNSQFIMSNSDSGGGAGTTNTQLISPVFSLVGYTDATLSFWHYYRGWISGTASVEVSIDGGTTYTVLPNSSWSTGTTGTSTGFVNKIVNLSAYVGQANMKIRFNYANATYGWYWAIDNVKVYGSNTSFVYWTPTTGLYNDAAGLIPYPGDFRATVYANPTATTTYTLEADSDEGCSNYGTVTVTVVPVNGGTTSVNQTLSCSTTPTNITLSGVSGTITGWQYSTSPTFASGIVDITPANTSTTLTAAEIGTLTSTRYYRAVVTNGSCTAYSTICAVIVTKTIWTGSWSNGIPDSTKAAEFQTNYPAGTGDVSACSVLVSSGAVVAFGSGETLTVQGEVKVNNGCSLSFANNASLYQVLDVANQAGTYNGNGGVANASNGNQGKITYSRTTPNIKYNDYTYWSNPVFSQTLSNFSSLSPYLGFYQYNNVTQAWNWVDPITAMTPAKGYIIRAPETFSTTVGAPWTGNFFGTPNSGTIPISVTSGSLNLIGNPYPSALDAFKFLTDVSNSGLGGTLYFWTHNTDMVSGAYTNNDYAPYNISGGLAANTGGAVPNGNISTGEAFFINGFTTSTATFKNSMRMAGNNNQFFKNGSNQMQDVSNASGLERHRYWLDIKNDEGAFKETLVAYVQTATMGLDRLFDGEMFDIGNAITMYTMVDASKLSIQGRSLPFDVNDTVPLGYKSTISGNFTINLRQFDGLFTEQHVYLEDKVLNVIHDLNESDYTFATESGTIDDRFVLRYTSSTLGINDPNFDENTIVVYHNAQGLHINSGTINMNTVSIFDIRGREIAKQNKIENTQTIFTNLPETNQVLLVKIQGVNGKTVTKKVVY